MESAADPRLVAARTFAAGIDLLICYVLFEIPTIYGLSVVFPDAYRGLGLTALVFSVGFLIPVWITYSFALEWLYARTPGKVNRGLMVVTEDGEPCTFRAAAVRNLARYIDVIGLPPIVLGTVLPVVADGRRVGDFLAGTRVVRGSAPDRESLVGPAAPVQQIEPSDSECEPDDSR